MTNTVKIGFEGLSYFWECDHGLGTKQLSVNDFTRGVFRGMTTSEDSLGEGLNMLISGPIAGFKTNQMMWSYP